MKKGVEGDLEPKEKPKHPVLQRLDFVNRRLERLEFKQARTYADKQEVETLMAEKEELMKQASALEKGETNRRAQNYLEWSRADLADRMKDKK